MLKINEIKNTIKVTILLLGVCSCVSSPCHRTFKIVNKSNKDIFMTETKPKYTTYVSCKKILIRIPSDSLIVWEVPLSSRNCWEKSIPILGLRLHFFEESLTLKPDCDEKKLNEAVVEQWDVTLEELRSNDWVLTYPKNQKTSKK